MKKTTLFLFTILLFSLVKAENYELSSPNNKLKVKIEVAEKIQYSLEKEGKAIIKPSEISMLFLNGEKWGKNEKVLGNESIYIKDTLKPIYGIQSTIIDEYNQLEMEFDSHFRIQFRLYNNGFAYRFIGAEKKKASIMHEQVSFNFSTDATVYFPEVKEYQQSFEAGYKKYRLSEIKKGKFALCPVLVQTENLNLLISESDLRGYPGMFIKKSKKAAYMLEGEFSGFVIEQDISNTGKLSPIKTPGNCKMLVKKRGEHIAKAYKNRLFPWRVLMIEENETKLLSNTLIYQLGPQPEEKTDWSWIKPGKVVYDKYHNHNIPGLNFEAGANTDTYKYYIDFAAENGFEYINLDFGWSSLLDLSKPVKKVRLQTILRYAKSKNVGVFIWMIWYELARDMKDYLNLFEQWGVAGIKVDNMDRDDQQMVEFCELLAQETAKRKLLVNLHGAYKPTGLARKYPNFISREAVLGLEYNKHSKKCTPQHNVTLPFTRNVVGPMDYTPGAMRYSTIDDFKKSSKSPAAMTTKAQQLAMYVVYYTPLQMIADAPTLYSDTCLNFLSKVPVSWDETTPLDGKTGEYIVLARKKGNDWYIGGMNGNQEKEVEIDFSFLENNTYNASILSDGEKPEKLKLADKILKKEDKLKLTMKIGGGFVIHLKPE